VTASGASTRDAACGDRHTDLGLLTECLEVRDVTGGRVTFDAHSVFPDGDDRVSTSALCFRDADTLREALLDAAFDDVEIRDGWSGEMTSNSSRLIVVRAQRA
jgi:hypothetical protein